MKFVLLFLLTFSSMVFAAQRGDVGLRGPNGATIIIDTSTTNITNAAYVQLSASLPSACSSVLLQNTGGQVIKLATGAAASEVDTGMVFPTSQLWMLPIELAKGKRLAVRSMTSTQSTGFLIFTCYQ